MFISINQLFWCENVQCINTPDHLHDPRIQTKTHNNQYVCIARGSTNDYLLLITAVPTLTGSDVTNSCELICTHQHINRSIPFVKSIIDQVNLIQFEKGQLEANTDRNDRNNDHNDHSDNNTAAVSL